MWLSGVQTSVRCIRVQGNYWWTIIVITTEARRIDETSHWDDSAWLSDSFTLNQLLSRPEQRLVNKKKTQIRIKINPTWFDSLQPLKVPEVKLVIGSAAVNDPSWDSFFFFLLTHCWFESFSIQSPVNQSHVTASQRFALIIYMCNFLSGRSLTQACGHHDGYPKRD